MGTLPMHSGFILKDYSEKVKRPAGFRQGAVRGKAAKPPHPQRSNPPLVKKDCFWTVSAKPLRESGGALPS